MRLSVILSFLIVTSMEGMAQNAYFKLGYQSFMDKDFKTAVRQLEKACMTDSNNTNALWMLGYSYFHSDNYKKSISTFSRVIALSSADADAYYFRSKAYSNLAKEGQLPALEKEKYLMMAISDVTKALVIKPDEVRNYQTRGLAYRDYATFKLQPNTRCFDKSRGLNALKAEIADFERVLNTNPDRADIASLLDVAKEKLATVVGHH